MNLLSLGLNATTLMGHDRWLSLPMAARAGLDAVELAAGRAANAMLMANSPQETLNNIQARLAAAGLKAHAIGAHRNLAMAEELAEFLLILELAAEIGCGLVTVSVPDACPEEKFTAGLFGAANRASELGVEICLENHGYEHGSGRSLLPLLDVHSGLRLCYDTGNVLYYSDAALEEDLPACVPHIRHLHLKDKLGGKGVWNFPPLGRGQVSFTQLLNRQDWPQPLSASIEVEFTPEGVTLAQTEKAVVESAEYLASLPFIRR